MPRDLLAGFNPPQQPQPQPQAPAPSSGGRDLLSARQMGARGPAAAPPAQAEQLGLAESAAQGAAQGVTFGFADELYGIGAGLIPGGQNRDEATHAARARYARANPAAALAGELAGSLLLPAGAVKAGASVGTRALRGAVAGAVTGGTGAVGRSEGSFEERLPAAGPGAALGAAFGGAGAAAAPAISQGARRLISGARGQPAAQQSQAVAQGAGRSVQNTPTQNPTADVEKLVRAAQGTDDVAISTREALESIQGAARGKRSDVNKAYDKIAAMEGAVEDKASFEMLSNKFNNFLDEEGVEFVEGGERITALADRVVSKLEGGATPQKMEQARQLLAKVSRGSNPQNPKEGLLLSQLQQRYDDWMSDTLINKLYTGDPKAITQIKEARGLSHSYHKLFGAGTGGRGTEERAAGALISRIIKDDVTPESAINLLFGASALGVKGTRRAMARIRDASPEAFEQLRSAHFTRVVTGGNGGEFLPGPQIAKKIQQLNNSGLAKALYGDNLREMNVFGNRVKGERNPAKVIGRFVADRPVLFRALAGGIGGAAVSDSDPTTTGIGALLLAGFRGGSGALGGAAARKAASKASRTGGPGRTGNIGGTLGGQIGPSLAGG